MTLQNYVESSKPNDLVTQVSICQRTGSFHHVTESPWPDFSDFNNRSFRVDTSSRVRAARSCRLTHKPIRSLFSGCFLPHCGTNQTAMSSSCRQNTNTRWAKLRSFETHPANLCKPADQVQSATKFRFSNSYSSSIQEYWKQRPKEYSKHQL